MTEKKKKTENKRQKMLALAFLADLESSQEITSQSKTEVIAATRIKKFLASDGCKQGIGEGWELCQTPIIYVDPTSQMSRNTTVILSDSDKQNFVIGVAGTNFINKYDWFIEDLQVSDQIPWGKDIVNYNKGYKPPFIDLQGVVSESTAIALSNTWNGQTSDGSGFLELLKSSLPTSGTVNLSITGHSLGGAISPALALALEENKADWCPSGLSVTISTYIFAGPSVGNQAWVNHLFKSLKSQPLEPRVISTYNKHDLVPHAWKIDMIEKMRSLFTPNLPSTNSKEIKGTIPNVLINWILSKSKNAKHDGVHHKYVRYNDDLTLEHVFKGTLPGTGQYSDVYSEAVALREVIEADWIKKKDNHHDALDAVCKICGVTGSTTVKKMDAVGPYLQYFCEFIVILGIEHVDAYHTWIDNQFLSCSMKYYLNLGAMSSIELKGVGVIYQLFIDLAGAQD